MLKDSNKYFFWKNGYFLFKSLFKKEKINDIKNEINFIFSNYCQKEYSEQIIFNLFQNDFQGFIGCANICQNLINLSKMQGDIEIIESLKSLGLNFPTINTRPLISISSHRTAKGEANWKVPAHQDWPSVQGSLNGVTCWVPLVDIDEELGPLEVLPKSHLLGFIDHEETMGVPSISKQFEEWLPVPMEVGDALFFNPFTIHRSGNNRSQDRIRWSMHFRYNDALESTFIERKYPRHRIDTRKPGILYPDFPTSQEMVEFSKKNEGDIIY